MTQSETAKVAAYSSLLAQLEPRLLHTQATAFKEAAWATFSRDPQAAFNLLATLLPDGSKLPHWPSGDPAAEAAHKEGKLRARIAESPVKSYPA